MRGFALAASAVMLAASASVVGLEHGNIPMPRRRRRASGKKQVTLDDLNYAIEYGDQTEARAATYKAELDRHTSKIEAAKAKRVRKAEKLKAVAEAGGIESVV